MRKLCLQPGHVKHIPSQEPSVKKTKSTTATPNKSPPQPTPGIEPLTPAEIEALRADKKRISTYARQAFADFAPKAD